MGASLQLPGGLLTLNPQPEISRYYNLAGNPYASTAQVLAQVISPIRYIGQTFLVLTQEYWFNPTTADADLVQKIAINSVTGVGTPNYVAKWGGSPSTLVNSILFDNGTNVLVGTATDNLLGRLQVNGDITAKDVRIGRGSNTGNLLFGLEAIKNTPSGVYNTAIGDYTLKVLTSGNYNTAIGYAALNAATNGSNNTSVGSYSMFYGVGGSNNTVVGNVAMLYGNGSNNTIMGYDAYYFGTGSNNIAIGVHALVGNSGAASGSYNIALGTFAGRNISTGTRNIVIENLPEGASPVPGGITTGSFNIVLNPRTRSGIVTGSNNVVIGGFNNTLPDVSNSIFIGDGAGNLRLMSGTTGNILINTPSDNNLDKLQVNGSLIATAIKKVGGLVSEYLMADGSVSTGTFNNITGIGAAGQVSFFTGTNTIAGDTGFLWDNTNKRLMVGTSTDNGVDRLQVAGSILANSPTATSASKGLTITSSAGNPKLEVYGHNRIDIFRDANTTASTIEGIVIHGASSTSGSNISNRGIVTFLNWGSGLISGIQGATLNYGNVRSGVNFVGGDKIRLWVGYGTGVRNTLFVHPSNTAAPDTYADSMVSIGSETNMSATKFNVVSTILGSSPFPRMTAAQRNAIVLPFEGVYVHQTDAPIGLYQYTAGAWTLIYSGVAGGAITGTGTVNYVPKFTTVSGLGNSLIYDNGTNVGVGTTLPGTRLTIVGNTTSDSAITQAYGGVGASRLAIDSSGSFVFGLDGVNGATERMRIGYTGNLLIGTTIDNAADKLQVNGSAWATNFQNSMAVDGTGKKLPTVDAVNFQANYLARALVFTGFLDTTDTFSLYKADDFTLGINASVYGVAFSQRFKQLPYAPSDGITNITARTVALSTIGLVGTGTAIKFVGYRHSDDSIQFSDVQFIQSTSVAQLGIVLVKFSGGVTSFIDANRHTITIPDIAAYSNLETNGIGVTAFATIDAIPGTLSHSNDAGKLTGISVGWGTSNNDVQLIAASSPTSFTRLHPGNKLTVTPPAVFTTMDPTQYWNGTALIPIPGSPNQATVQRLLFTVRGNFVWQYGEQVYSNLVGAQNNILQANFTDILPQGTFAEIGRMAITVNCSDLSSTSAQYYPSNGGGGGGTATGPTVWGTITGSIDDQLDLKAKLDARPVGSGVADQVTFFNGPSSVTGDNTFRWDNTNKKLSIGTTAGTGSKLSLIDNIASVGPSMFTVQNTNATGQTGFSILNNASGAISIQATSAGYVAPFQNVGSIVTQGVSALIFCTDGGTLNTGTTPIKFRAGGYAATDTMTIVAGNPGRVLIGTTTDTGTHRLQVAGDSLITGSSASAGSALLVQNSAATAVLQVDNNGLVVVASGATIRNASVGGITIQGNQSVVITSGNFVAGGIRLGTGTGMTNTVNTFAAHKVLLNISTIPGAGSSDMTVNDFANQSTINLTNVTGLKLNRAFYVNPTLSGLTKPNNYIAFQSVKGGVFINTTTPEDAAVLQADSLVQGSMPFPRMTAAQRIAIVSPPEGLYVHQIDAPIGLYQYTNGAWILIQSAISNAVTGSGLTNYVPKWSTANTLGNSLIYDNGANVGIGTIAPYDMGASIKALTLNNASTYSGGVVFSIADAQKMQLYVDADGLFSLQGAGGVGIKMVTAGTEKMRIPVSGNVLIGTTTDNTADKLQVSGSATVDRLKYTQAIAISGVDLNTILDAGFYNGTGMPNAPSPDWFWVTVERHGDPLFAHQTATSFGVTGGFTTANKVFTRTRWNGTWTAWAELINSASGSLSGSGTPNYISKWSTANSLGDSIIVDNGTNLIISHPSGYGNAKVFINKANQSHTGTVPDGGLLIADTGDTSKGLELGVTNVGVGFIQTRDLLSQAYGNLLINPNAGNVLIGTTTDNSVDKLQVNGNIGLTGSIRQTTDGTHGPLFVLRSTQPSGNYGAFIIQDTGGALAYLGDANGSAAGGGTTGDFAITAPSGELWFTASTSQKFFAGGLERMRVVNSGNILIGSTTDNGSLLQVGSSSGATATPTSISLDTTFRVGAPAFDKLKLYLFKSPSESYGFTVSELADIQYWAGSNLTGQHRFFTAQNERMTIKAGGNILIGLSTDNASDRLQVGGSILSDGLRYGRALDLTGSNLNTFLPAGFYGGNNMVNAPDSGYYYLTQEVSSSTYTHQMATSFGVGNTPNRVFTRVNVGGTWGDWAELLTSSSSSISGNGTPNYIPKWSGSTSLGNSIMFDDGTNIGIGTTSPNGADVNRRVLDINGVSAALLGLSVGGVLKGYLFHSGTNLYLANENVGSTMIFQTSGADRMLIAGGGNVLIGTNTDNTVDRLQVSGGLTVDGGISTANQQFHIRSIGITLPQNAGFTWVKLFTTNSQYINAKIEANMSSNNSVNGFTIDIRGGYFDVTTLGFRPLIEVTSQTYNEKLAEITVLKESGVYVVYLKARTNENDISLTWSLLNTNIVRPTIINTIADPSDLTNSFQLPSGYIKANNYGYIQSNDYKFKIRAQEDVDASIMLNPYYSALGGETYGWYLVGKNSDHAYAFEIREGGLNPYFSITNSASGNGGKVLIGTATNNGVDMLQVNGSARVNRLIYTQATIISGADLNTLTEAGFYNGSALVNAPDGGWFWVTVERHGDPAYSHQVATSFDGRMYTRVRYDSTWLAWDQLSTAAGSLSGSGNTNFVPKWTSGSTLGDSIIADNNTYLGLNFAGGGMNMGVDANGIFYNALGDFGHSFYVNSGAGGARMVIAASGNVLVGATVDNTVDKLQVNGSILSKGLYVDVPTPFTFSPAPTASAIIGSKGLGGSLVVETPSLSNEYNSGLAVDGTYTGGKSVINVSAFGVSSGGPYSADLAFKTSTNTTLSEKMRLTNAGNLLINTTSDNNTDKLQVEGSTSINGSLNYSFGAATGTLQSFISPTGGLYTYYSSGGVIGSYSDNALTYAPISIDASQFNLRLAGNSKMFIPPSGNVLINTATDNGVDKLQVNGSALVDQLRYTRAIAVSAGSDLNDLTLAGFYDGVNLLNAPEGNGGWFWITVETYHTGPTWLHQTATSFGSANVANRMFTRVNSGGVWSAWAELLTSASGILSGSGTAGYVPLWTNTNTLGVSKITQSALRVQIDSATIINGIADGTTSFLLFTNDGVNKFIVGAENSMLGTSNDNFGSYVYGTGDYFVFANSAKQLSIKGTTGNVLIGTSTDNAIDKLQVAGTASINDVVNVLGARPITIASNIGQVNIKGDPGGWANGYLFRGSANTQLGGFGAYGSGNGLAYYYVGDSFSNASMIVKSTVGGNGNVLIGTDVDNGWKLRVQGDIFSSGNIWASNIVYGGGALYSPAFQDGVGNGQVLNYFNSNILYMGNPALPSIVIETANVPSGVKIGGNVVLHEGNWTTYINAVTGSGTVNNITRWASSGTITTSNISDDNTKISVTIPIRKEYVVAGSSATPVFEKALIGGIYGTYESSIQFGNAFSSSGGTYIKFVTNSTGGSNLPVDAMTITPLGYIGVGVNTPENKLDVRGGAFTLTSEQSYAAKFGNNSNKGVIIGYDTTNNIGHIGSVSPGVGWTALSLNANGGSLLVGTTVDNGSDKLQVGGRGLFSGSLRIAGSLATAQPSNITLFQENPDRSVFSAFGSTPSIKGEIILRQYSSDGVAYDAIDIKSNGNVLIGTITDGGAYKLQVNGATKISGPAGTQLLVDGAATVSRIDLAIAGTALGRVQFDTTTGLILGTYSTAHTNLMVNSSVALRVNGSSGNVTIGDVTDDGTNKLQVIGYAKATGYRIPGGLNTQFLMADGSTSLGGGGGGTISGSGTANYVPKFTSGTAIGNSVLYDLGVNNVMGIGTTTPRSVAGYASLTLDNTAGSSIHLRVNGADGGGLRYDASGLALRTIVNTGIFFETNNTEKMRLVNNGNLLIGTTSDNGSKLQVSGATSITASGVTSLVVSNSSTDNAIFTLGASAGANAASVYSEVNSNTQLNYAFQSTINGTRGIAYTAWTANSIDSLISVSHDASQTTAHAPSALISHQNGIGLQVETGGNFNQDSIFVYRTTGSTGNPFRYQLQGSDKAYLNINGEWAAQKFIKAGGTNLQYLMADGSVTSSSAVTDPNALHKTGDESFTGTKSSITANAPAIFLQTAGSAYPLSIDIPASSDAGGIDIFQTNAFTGTYGTAINIYRTTSGTPLIVGGGQPFLYNYNGTIRGSLEHTGEWTGVKFRTIGASNTETVQGDGSLLALTTGSYTPTFTGLSNVTAPTSVSCTYTQIGKVITGRISFICSDSAASAVSQLNFSVPASHTIVSTGGLGSGTKISGTTAPNYSIFVSVNSTTTIKLYWYATSTGSSGVAATFQYVIN